ncbi:MAG TPA: DUF4167 domain-containing protein [Pseudolabrys sp.]
MRNGQQKRMRGRGNNNHRKSQNPLTRVYESNGPDVKIRGTASHVAEKYIQLARDSQSSGDPVAAENYYQHAEHYFRLIAAAQEQFRQQNPYYNPQQGGTPQGAADDSFDDEGDDQPTFMGQNEPSFGPREPQAQPYLPRDAQPFPQQRDQQHQQPRQQQTYAQPQQPQQQQQQPSGEVDAGGGLPAFITGGGQQPQQQNGGQNGQEQGDRGDRFGHRRRRRRGGGGSFRPERAEFGSQSGTEGGEPGAE